jgi:hypothetical protein
LQAVKLGAPTPSLTQPSLTVVLSHPYLETYFPRLLVMTRSVG